MHTTTATFEDGHHYRTSSLLLFFPIFFVNLARHLSDHATRHAAFSPELAVWGDRVNTLARLLSFGQDPNQPTPNMSTLAPVELDEDTKLTLRVFAEFLSVHGLTYTLNKLEPEARIPKIPKSQLWSVFSNGQQREIFRGLGVDFVIRAHNALAASSPRGSPRGASSPRFGAGGTPRSTPLSTPRRRNSKKPFSPPGRGITTPRSAFGSPRNGANANTSISRQRRYSGGVGSPRKPMIVQLLEFVRAHREGGVAGLQQLQNISEAEELLRQREALLEHRKEDAEKWLQQRQDAMAKALHEERSRRLRDLNDARKLELMHKKQHQQRQVRPLTVFDGFPLDLMHVAVNCCISPDSVTAEAIVRDVVCGVPVADLRASSSDANNPNQTKPNHHQAELDNERERLEMLERKVTRETQALQRERQHFEFRSQQEAMIGQLVEDKKELTQRATQLSETLLVARSE